MEERNLVVAFFIAMLMASCVNHDLDKQVDCSQSGLTLTIDSVIQATSCSIADGKIFVSAQGGKQPYTFNVNGQVSQALPAFSDLSSGIYSVAVRDHSGCESSANNITVLAKDFRFSADVVDDSNCLNHNGSVTITVDAGNPPFSFRLNDGAFTGANSFTALTGGRYSITVKDNSDCTVQLSVTVPRVNTGTSWSIDILPIMKASCALNGCHDGKTRFDYKDYQTVKKYAASIESMTKDGSMPFDGPPLPASQVALIACWVDDGAAEN